MHDWYDEYTHTHTPRAQPRHAPVREKNKTQPIEGTDIYVALVFSAQELPDLQELTKIAPEAKIVFFNLRLDTLRGDLGLPAFPPKVTF